LAAQLLKRLFLKEGENLRTSDLEKKKINALCTVKPTSTDNERAFSAGIGIFGFFFYCMALFLVGVFSI
jgi:hypothetical protein